MDCSVLDSYNAGAQVAAEVYDPAELVPAFVVLRDQRLAALRVSWPQESVHELERHACGWANGYQGRASSERRLWLAMQARKA